MVGVVAKKFTMGRMHMSRVIAPFFLGALCMYAMLIFYSYPSLSKRMGHRHRYAVDYGYTEYDVDMFVDRIPRRIGQRSGGTSLQKRATLVDAVLMKKRAFAQKERHFKSKEGQIFEQELVTVENDTSKSDEMKADEEAQPNVESNKKYYNKDITVPKNKHYVDEPIDKHDYRYIHKPDVCRKPGGRRIKMHLIFMVTTAPRNFERRMLIRNTYGNKRHWPVLSTGTYRTVFLLGAVSDPALQRQIDVEARNYSDIVQEDFVDSYANLTLKTAMGLKWVTNHCRQSTYTMKIDDDSMIHQNRLLRLLKNATTSNFTAAEALIDAPVLRNTSSKYYISEEYFPAPTYPPYLNGPGYLMSTDLAEGLYRVAITTPLFPWEDVFMGLCLKQLGVFPIVYKNFILIIAEYSQIEDKRAATKLFKYYTVVSNLEPEYMTLMWNACHFKMKKS